MNFIYTKAKVALCLAGLNLKTGDIRALLVMSNSSAGADRGAEFLSGATGIQTLDEMTGSGYSRQALAGEDVIEDPVLFAAKFIANNVAFGATIANGPRQVMGAILYKHVGADTANIPVFWIDSVDSGPIFPYSPNGGPISLKWPGSVVFRLN